MKRNAVISPDGKYRYWLERQWGATSTPCIFAMLNPSTADAKIDDPTIRRCMGYAKAWGYDRLVVINLFALRSTSPEQLYCVRDPVGPDNATYWEKALQSGGILVCAWGAHGSLMGQDKTALGWCGRECITPHYLRLTKMGKPGHPLYLPSALTPSKWSAAA